MLNEKVVDEVSGDTGVHELYGKPRASARGKNRTLTFRSR